MSQDKIVAIVKDAAIDTVVNIADDIISDYITEDEKQQVKSCCFAFLRPRKSIVPDTTKIQKTNMKQKNKLKLKNKLNA